MQNHSNTSSLRIALSDWSMGIGDVISKELLDLGHKVRYCELTKNIPDDIDLIFTFGPYGAFDEVVNNLRQITKDVRPPHIHWSTQGMPSLHIPIYLVKSIGLIRSSFGQIKYSNSLINKNFATKNFYKFLNSKMSRFHFVGDYFNAYRSVVCTGCTDL